MMHSAPSLSEPLQLHRERSTVSDFKRIPRHVAVIPDGNRRWAVQRGFNKDEGYQAGLPVGFRLYETAVRFGIKELTFYGFTVDNTKRPSQQTRAFQRACVDAVELLSHRDASILVVGDSESPMFPAELKQYTRPHVFGRDLIRINFLVNYSWSWDLNRAIRGTPTRSNSRKLDARIGSDAISRIDLVIRWGARCRLSGMLPVQTVYSDFYVVDDLWPDYTPQHFIDALKWYQNQDVTLGG